jgi:hypothetical protein
MLGTVPERACHVVMVLLATLIPFGVAASSAAQDRAAAECGDWQDCRQRTTEALTRGEYETAHDLAWRAMQKGPKNNPELMFLLARTQSLSGRPNDALVMLERVVASGATGSAVAAGAVADEDFRRVRERPAWPTLEAKLTGAAAAAPDASPAAAAPAAPATPAPTTKPTTRADAKPPAPPAAAATPPAATATPPAAPTTTPAAPLPGVVEEAARFVTSRFAAGGLAYDAVSGRFVFGDLHGRKLIVAQDGVDHAVDFVRSESAGFYQVMSLAIDVPRGDLWVASAETGGGAGAVHKVQLISGRPLKKYDVAADLQPVRLVDLAVGSAGTILALDAVSGRVLRVSPRAEQMQSLVQVKAETPASITMGRDEQVAYVAHREGLSRIDLASHRVTRLRGPKDVELGGFERIRWYRDALVGIQKATDGSRRIVRLQLNPAGRAIVSATMIQETVASGDGPVFATVSDNQFSYLVSSAADGSSAEAGEISEVIVYRISLADRQ